MPNLATVAFGNADGIRVIEEPVGFNVGESLRSTVDISYPFLWGKEVYRAAVFENGSDRYIFIGLYTKIDDFGGARDGALAGAGVFIRDGVCDGAVVVDSLRRTLGQLIKVATDGAKFVARLESVDPEIRTTLKSALSALGKAHQSERIRATRDGQDHEVSIVDASDWRVQSPEQFVEFVSQLLLYETKHYLYAPDPEMRDAVPFAGQSRRVSLGQRLLRLPTSFAEAYARAEQDRRAAVAEVVKWKGHVETLEMSLAATRTKNDALQSELQKSNSVASLYGESDREATKLRSEVASLKQQNERLTADLAAARHGRKGGDSSTQIRSLKIELENCRNELNARYDELDELRRSLANKSGGVKPTTWIVGAIGLLLALIATFLIWAFGGKQTANVADTQTTQRAAVEKAARERREAADQAAKDKAAADQAAKDKAAADQAAADQAAKDKAAADQAAADQAAKDKAAAAKAAKDKAAAAKAAKDKAAAAKAAKDKAAADQVADDNARVVEEKKN